MLHDLRLHWIVLSEVNAELLGYFLAHEPLKWALARSQKRSLILHLLDLDLNQLLIRDRHSLVFVFICGFRARLQNHLGVVDVHDL